MAKKGTLVSAEVAGRSITFSWNGTVSGNSTVISYSLVSSGSDPVGTKVTLISLVANNKQLFYTSNYEATHTAVRTVYNYTPLGETITTGSFTVKHDSNGDATLNVTLSCAIYDNTTRTSSKTFTLDKTATASILNLPTFTLGGNGSPITFIQGSDKTTLLSSYGHKLKYKIGTMSTWHEVYDSKSPSTTVFYYEELSTNPKHPNARSFLFDPPESDYKYITNGAINGQMILYTYSDRACTNLIGTSEINMKVTIPDKFKPVIENVSFVFDNSAYLSLSSLNAPISNITNISPRFTVTAFNNGSVGGFIKKVSISNNVSKSASVSAQTLNITNQLDFVITTSGEKNFTITATDDKGLSTSVQTDNINIIGYDKPRVDYFIANRRGSSTTVAVCCNVLFASINIDGVEKNGIDNIKLYYRESGNQTFYEYTDATLENEIFVDVLNFNNLKRYYFKIIATDYFGQTVESNIQPVPKAEIYIHKPSGGRGLGIGTNITEDDKTKSEKIVKIGYDWDVELQGINYSVRECLNPRIYHHEFTLKSDPTTGTNAWNDFTASQPSWRDIPDGVYRVTTTVTLKGSGSGMATSRWYTGADEYSSSDQRTRGTVPITTKTSTINTVWYFKTSSYGNHFSGWLQVYSSVACTPQCCAVWIERIADGYTDF